MMDGGINHDSSSSLWILDQGPEMLLVMLKPQDTEDAKDPQVAYSLTYAGRHHSYILLPMVSHTLKLWAVSAVLQPKRREVER